MYVAWHSPAYHNFSIQKLFFIDVLMFYFFPQTNLIYFISTHFFNTLDSFVSFSVQQHLLTQCHLKASVIRIVFTLIVNEDVKDDAKCCSH